MLTMSPLALNEHVRGLHARALAGEKVVFEARARRKNGERFDIETRGVPILRQGRPHVLYIGRDITARKSDEKALRASEEQYRAIFNAAADALVLRDAEFRIVDVNPAYVALSGFSREEVIGKQHVVANPPETEARIRALHARALAGEPVMLETVRICKDGTRRDVELRGVPILHRGEPHVLYIGRDISERKRTEERLRASEEQYRSIFNAATDALVLRDDQARVVDVNPAFLEISGFTREEVIAGQRWFFAGPEQAVLAKEMHSRVIAGESVDFEVQGVRKDGTRSRSRCARCRSCTAAGRTPSAWRATSPRRSAPRPSARSSKRSCARRSAWRRSATSPAASRTTSTTCWRASWATSCSPRSANPPPATRSSPATSSRRSPPRAARAT